MRFSFETLLVVLVFAARKHNHAIAEFPALQLAVIAGAAAENLGNPLHQFHGVLVYAAQDQGAFVDGQGQPKPELGFAAPSLSAIKQFVGLAFIRIPLRTIIGRPQDMARALAPDPCRLIPHRWCGILEAFGDLVGRVTQCF
jgi:hypothetical protein